jgi:pimeloyl-ACP methyl ester carboxylesterase
METLKLEASGMTFDALAEGDGRTVMLLHGFPQTSREWAGMLPALARAGYRAVAPDQRGYSPGARPREVEAYAGPALAGDVIALADALGAERVDLVGHDWGAAVAWDVAARFPERVRSLVAVSVPHPLAMTRAMSDPDQRERSAYIRVFRREGGVAERGFAESGWRRLRGIYDGKVADVDHYVEFFSDEGALTAALNWYRAMKLPDVQAIGPVAVPTLFVWGAEDVAVGRTAAEGAADFVTGPYRFVELTGVGHWVPDEAPERLTREVLDHLSRHD